MPKAPNKRLRELLGSGDVYVWVRRLGAAPAEPLSPYQALGSE